MISLGKLTYKSKLSQKERESDLLYQFDLEMAINNITKHTQEIESLKLV